METATNDSSPKNKITTKSTSTTRSGLKDKNGIVNEVVVKSGRPRQEIQKVLRSCTAPKKSVTFPEVKTIKCILVGDNQIGKTALVQTFLFDDFHKDYIPTARDDYTYCTTFVGEGSGVTGMDIDLDICDTGGRVSQNLVIRVNNVQCT